MAKKAYTQEKKSEVLELLKSNFTVKEISEQTGVSMNTVYNWRDVERKKASRGYDATEVNKTILELAGDNDLSPFIGKEICKMSLREIITFLRLLGVKGQLSVETRLKL